MANLKNDNKPQASNHSLVTKGIWIILRQMGMKVVISVCVCESLSHIQLFGTPWTVTVSLPAPLSMGFSRQEYWSGLPFPSPGDLPDPGIGP